LIYVQYFDKIVEAMGKAEWGMGSEGRREAAIFALDTASSANGSVVRPGGSRRGE